MQQAKFSLEEANIKFLEGFRQYGFKDKSTLVRRALEYLRKELESNELRKSAELYAEIYEKSSETQKLTESALSGWPE